MMFSAIALAADQPCPIHPHERNEHGDVLPEFAYKENRTCWQEHWDGEEFPGVNGLFGQLCYYLDRSTHSMMPNTSPGLFIGWHFSSGLRYRKQVYVADFELCRQGRWNWRESVRLVHESEVHFPEVPEFPWAVAREQQIMSLRSIVPIFRPNLNYPHDFLAT